ncbi:N-acetylmuramoyl-L-alanine amidase, partial [Gordonibacter urolithinfaciens]|uniref:N-acetylmuramoyl-L-alanine amidase n=1 Tax=Gordonibacter urolithinfaciens TaxID=1335613 RepID=UPI000FEF6077
MDSGEVGMFGKIARAMLSAILTIGVALPAMLQVAFADDEGSVAAVTPEQTGISLAASSQGDGAMPVPEAEGDVLVATSGIEDSAQTRVGFVYIDAPALFVGGTQDVVVALDETEAVVRSAELFYVDTAGVQKSVAANRFAGNAALFEISVGEAGDYEVRSMAATLADGSVVALDLYDEERAAYPGFIAVSAAVDPFSIDGGGSEGVALTFSLDSDGGLVAGKSLPDVIGSAALQARASSNLSSSDDGTLVIVLDAGHGGSDPGAVANGLLEKDLTLSIARYCKEALGQYANVKVCMTRSSDFYVGLKERVDYAVSVGADAFVGIHINSAGTSGANGAEVWYPNASSWYYEAHVEGRQLAESILEKLTELGLYDRGVKVRDSDDELNPDGSVADYYATIRYARQVGMPSIIVEHAFITGDGDSQKLAQDAWLKAMGEADAEGIAQAYGLSKGHWVFEDGVWHWYEGSTMVINAWKNIDGMRHWFGPDGVAVRGWHDIDGSRYYFDPGTANLHRGWYDEGGRRYRLDRDDGHLWTGWYTVDGVWYCSDENGVLRKGWYDEGGRRYRLDRDDGHLWTG